MLENWKKDFGKGGYICAIEDLWQTEPHLINSQVWGLWIWYKSSILHKTYLGNKKQRVHVYSNLSSWQEIITGYQKVPF